MIIDGVRNKIKNIKFENESVEVLLPENFRAGRLKQFLDEWKDITSDKTILDTVKGCHIEITNEYELNQLSPSYPLRFNEREADIVSKEVYKMLDKNVIEKCNHCSDEIISNIFIRQKKDKSYRVILNLKKFNSYVEYNHFKMESLQSALNLMKQGCYMASVDLKDAYYSVPLAREYRKFMRFMWKGELFQYTCLVMGLACSPRKFTKLMKPVYSDLRKLGFSNVPYIDDVYLQGDNQYDCWENVKTTVNKLQSLGFILNIEKSVFIPKQEIVFLGFILNSVEMTVKLTQNKIDNLYQCCQKILKLKKVKILEISQLLGFMVASFPGVEYGPLFYRTLENDKIDALKYSRGDYNASMEISLEARNDINWWIENVHKCMKQICHGEPNFLVRTDASSSGWGAEFDNVTTGGRWNEQELQLHINEQELLAVLFALKSLCKKISCAHVHILSDNTTTVCYINAMGGSKSRSCNKITREIWFWCINKEIWLSASHIPGSKNTVADRCSRVFNDHTEWMLNPKIFNKISTLWGPFDIDIFAPRLNKQLPKYVAWKPDPNAEFIDAFSVNLNKFYFYAFPPFSVISRVLQKIQKEKAEGVMVVPVWPTQTWYTSLLELLVDVPRIIQKEQGLLKLPHSEEKHSMKITLMACRVSGSNSKNKEFRETYYKSSKNRGEDLPGVSMQQSLRNGQASVVKGVFIFFNQL